MSDVKALALLSGGLDSSLAIKLIQEQGIQVHAFHFYTGFCITEHKRRLGIKKKDGSHYTNPALKAAVQLNVPLEIVDISEEYFDVVLNPKYGYGANVNPCIDCRIMMLRKAKEIMQERGYHFVITGEVLGQRPMSQRMNTLRLIEKESGLEGYILRPLSAKLLPPTIPEKLGWIDREKLLGIRGRGRKVQIELAKKYGLDYEQPAGGCCYLTDPNYALKFRETLNVEGRITKEDLLILSVGRHLRLPSGAKLIVARNEGELNFLKGFTNRYGYARREDQKGTLVLIKGMPTEEEYPIIAGIVCRYSKKEPATVLIKIGDKETRLWAEPATEETIESLKIIKEKVHGVE
ncbi:asparagine synthase-related protein [Thermocrinis sp.]|uniref:asparagine synthase-related protein n=1 Tax=Thermocrinis sp. TaxID=2024383 RepID=UPI002FDEEAD3